MDGLRLDDLDERIVQALRTNSRASYRRMAAQLGVAHAPLINRVRKLEAEGVIEGYGAYLDYSKLGYDYVGVTEITIKEGDLLQVQRKIASMPEVVSVFDTTGQSDSIVISRCRSRQDFSVLVKKILAIKNVERTNTHFVFNVVKDNYRIALPPETKKP